MPREAGQLEKAGFHRTPRAEKALCGAAQNWASQPKNSLRNFAPGAHSTGYTQSALRPRTGCLSAPVGLHIYAHMCHCAHTCACMYAMGLSVGPGLFHLRIYLLGRRFNLAKDKPSRINLESTPPLITHIHEYVPKCSQAPKHTLCSFGNTAISFR